MMYVFFTKEQESFERSQVEYEKAGAVYAAAETQEKRHCSSGKDRLRRYGAEF